MICCRHFKALARKNFINWYRTPICSFLEIVFPALLMYIIVILRNKIGRTTAVDEAGMFEKKYPIFPGLKWENNQWA